jgi:predicted nucleotidyltransferase
MMSSIGTTQPNGDWNPVNESVLNLPAGLPENTARVLTDFVLKAQQVFAEDFVSAVLFGSAADGSLRKSSDVNLLLVLKRYDLSLAEKIRNELATAEAAVLLRVMFLCRDEIPGACEAFAQKFSDILRRHVVLLGKDPFEGIAIPRPAQVRRLRQVLLNLLLRLRAMHAAHEVGSRPSLQMLAESTGPLRSSASLLLTLEGQDALKPKAALLRVSEEIAPGRFSTVLSRFSQLRETATLSEADAQIAFQGMMELTAAMYARAATLRE